LFRFYSEWFKEPWRRFRDRIPTQAMPADQTLMTADSDARLRDALGSRSLVLVGMMGAGKSSIGRKLAQRLHLPFVDADTEVERAAGMSISDIFAKHGEPYFRAGEARVIARLLEAGPQVLATGGGAFMHPQLRETIRARGVSVWLKAEHEVLMRRIKRRGDRPLLKQGDAGETLRRLLAERDPVYAEADVTVLSRDVPHDVIIGEIVAAVAERLQAATVGERAS
jgi:shikimate kinase